MLYSLEGDANCSRSTKYVSKLVKDFLDEPLKKTETPNNTSVPLSAGGESIFFLGIKTFFARKG